MFLTKEKDKFILKKDFFCQKSNDFVSNFSEKNNFPKETFSIGKYFLSLPPKIFKTYKK